MGNTLERLERELKRWPEVEYWVDYAPRHPRLWVKRGDNTRFIPFSTTKVGRYGLMQKLTQLRRVLRQLGEEECPKDDHVYQTENRW